MNASVISKSTTSESKSIIDPSDKQFNIVADSFFHFINDITQHINLPQFLYIPFLIIVLFQHVYVSFWAEESNIWKFSTFNDIFASICFFRPFIISDNQTILAVFVAFFIVFGFIFLSIIIELVFYKNKRRFNRMSLYPCRIFLELFSVVMILPNASFLSFLFNYLFTENKTSSIVGFFVVEIVLNIIIPVIFYYSNLFIGISPYLAYTPLAVFDITPYLLITAVNPFFHSISSICTHFASWLQHPIIAVHIIFTIMVIFRLVYRPFVKIYMNTLFLITSILSVLLDIMKLASLFFPKPNYTLIFYLFFVFLLFSIIFSVLFYHFQSKFIFKELKLLDSHGNESPLYNNNNNNNNNNDPNNNGSNSNNGAKINIGNMNNSNTSNVPTTTPIGSNAIGSSSQEQDEKVNAFISMKLDSDLDKALMYLHFMISKKPKLFCDFLLIRFIIHAHCTERALCSCVKCVAFFPTQSRSLNITYHEMRKMKYMSLKYQFFLFQVERIKLIRQSSTSNISLERLHELKQSTKELRNNLETFWSRNDVSTSFFLKSHNNISKIKSLWEEALDDFPNSLPYNEEHRVFQIECETDFTGAIRQKHKADMIETGNNFAIDICFRQFVRNFPFYLKDKILDIKGNFLNVFLKKKNGSNSSANSGSGKAMSSFSSFSELDAALEEGIGRLLINHSRIRLALQHATGKKKANMHYIILVISILVLVVGVFLSIYLFSYFNGFFETRMRSLRLMQYVLSTRADVACCVFTLLNYWGNITQTIDMESHAFLFINESNQVSYFPTNRLWDTMTLYFNSKSRSSFDKFLSEVTILANQGLDVYSYMGALFGDGFPIFFCDKDVIIKQQNLNMKIMLNYLFINSALVFNKTNNINNWFTGEYQFCSAISTFSQISLSFNHLRKTMTKYQTDTAFETKKMLTIEMYCYSIVFGVFAIIVFSIPAVMYLQEIKKFSDLLIKLPNQVKLEASLPLRKEAEADADIQSSHESANSASIPLLLLFIFIIVTICISLMFFFQILNTSKCNDKFQNLNVWIANSAVRIPTVVEIEFYIFQLILSENPLVKPSHFINADQINQQLLKYCDEIEVINKEFLEGTAEYPSPYGASQTIDDILLKDTCLTNNDDSSFHEMYRCASANQQMNIYLNLVFALQKDYTLYQGNIKDAISTQTVHFLSNHLLPKFANIDQDFDDLINFYSKGNDTEQVGFFVGELFIIVICFLVMIYLIKKMEHIYSTVIVLLRRVSPVAIVADTRLVNYLLNKSSETNKAELSVEHAIIYNSKDSVLCIGNNGTIEIINPAVMKTFGFTPEQLLGQPFITVIAPDLQTQISSQIALMLNHQSAATYEDHTVCMSDDDSAIPCAITILAVSSSTNEDKIKSFVIILKDESTLLRQQEEAEKAKKQSETLLYQILPRDIAIRLSQGEKDISFSVPSATIMFVDIVRFSEYAASLTPQEIMGNLSFLFGGFDEAIAKFPLLIKIKLIGDVYMCAGGLFSPEEPPVNHAEQMLKFGIESLQILEDTNLKLSSILSVRIGVNTGGPLIAGVLGTDKPTFDIIGDPINIASRLQSTDISGNIQISQNTYDLVSELEFQIEPRGEVFLKGKGKSMTYLVSQPKSLQFNVSSQDGIQGSGSSM